MKVPRLPGHLIHGAGGRKDPTGTRDLTFAKAVGVLSASESIQSAKPVLSVTAVPTVNDNSRPSGDQDSGTCASPAAAVVSRSAPPSEIHTRSKDHRPGTSGTEWRVPPLRMNGTGFVSET